MIVICDKCRGVGEVCFDVGTHKSEDEYEQCDLCRGSGRLIEKTTTTHRPFVPEEACATRLY